MLHKDPFIISSEAFQFIQQLQGTAVLHSKKIF